MKLTVVVPIRNESENVVPFYERAQKALELLTELEEWSLLFVNNASEDDSLERVLALRSTDPRVKVLSLSRDFGYHPALVAGLSAVDSDYYAVVDVDGEDPPELLVQFYEAIQQGAQVAYGIRSKRDEPPLVTFGRKLFYYANRQAADSEIVMWMGEFSMMTRQVRDAILAPKTTFPFLRAELGYVGFTRAGIPYLRAKRMHGKSHYNFWRMSRFAIAGILSSSSFPLRFVLYLAICIGLVFPIVVGVFRLSAEVAARLAIFCSMYFLLMSIPFIALYLARAYKNGVARPVYVVDWTKSQLDVESSLRSKEWLKV